MVSLLVLGLFVKAVVGEREEAYDNYFIAFVI